MKTLLKAFNIILSISYLPLLLGYLAYGNTYELVLMIITLAWVIGLILLSLSSLSKKSVIIILLLGSVVFIDSIFNFETIYSDGTDPRVTIAFTLQSIVAFFIIIFNFKRHLKSDD